MSLATKPSDIWLSPSEAPDPRQVLRLDFEYGLVALRDLAGLRRSAILRAFALGRLRGTGTAEDASFYGRDVIAWIRTTGHIGAEAPGELDGRIRTLADVLPDAFSRIRKRSGIDPEISTYSVEAGATTGRDGGSAIGEACRHANRAKCGQYGTNLPRSGIITRRFEAQEGRCSGRNSADEPNAKALASPDSETRALSESGGPDPALNPDQDLTNTLLEQE